MVAVDISRFLFGHAIQLLLYALHQDESIHPPHQSQAHSLELLYVVHRLCGLPSSC